jgi:hypothetical protein
MMALPPLNPPSIPDSRFPPIHSSSMNPYPVNIGRVSGGPSGGENSPRIGEHLGPLSEPRPYNPQQVPCLKHGDKQIEYFCVPCN